MVVEATQADVGAHERRYRKLIENIRDTVTVVDASGAPVWTSASSRGDLGYDDSFWSGADLFGLVHDEDRPKIELGLVSILEDPSNVLDGEVRLQQPDGSYRHVSYRAVNLLADDDIAGIVITAKPIDSEVLLRRERQDRQDELEEALAERAQFIADLSHEMRSPLHAITGLTELVLSSGDLQPALDRHLQSINKESQALRLMLDELLDFSKISANRLELLSDPFSPGAVVDAVGASQTTRARERHLAFSINIDPSVPLAVLGDEHRLRQILINLVSNAIKYTDVGSVELAARRVDSDAIEFSVADTGQGIPEDAWPTLFEPYRQAREHDTTKGTGLGLVITKRLVELMEGTLTFDTSSEGTTFVATIPFREARRRSDVVAPVAAPVVATARLDVLVVDDSAVNLMLAQSQLERLGHTPTTVDSGQAAIDILATRRFDLVLMDWHMPHMDGLETTRLIRSNESGNEHVPIIATTASVMAGDRETCLDAGMDDYLPKPVSLSDLSIMIGRWSTSDASHEPDEQPDASGANRLVEELGDPDIVRAVIDAFLAEVPGWRSSLEEGTASGDFVLARRAAHTLKSTAQLLGAAQLAELGADFDATEEPALLIEKLPPLLDELTNATVQLGSMRDQLDPAQNP